MNTRVSAVVLAIAALVLLAHASTALGAGKITGLTLNLRAIKTCAIETITVKGTGSCPSYTVFFGDGNKLITLGKPTPFPNTYHHAYSKMGTYKVSAEAYTGPGSTCSGKASATVQVAAGPTITAMFTLGFFFLVGCHAWRADTSKGGEFRRCVRGGGDPSYRLERLSPRLSATEPHVG
jgi:hypothetical protein